MPATRRQMRAPQYIATTKSFPEAITKVAGVRRAWRRGPAALAVPPTTPLTGQEAHCCHQQKGAAQHLGLRCEAKGRGSGREEWGEWWNWPEIVAAPLSCCAPSWRARPGQLESQPLLGAFRRPLAHKKSSGVFVGLERRYLRRRGPGAGGLCQHTSWCPWHGCCRHRIGWDGTHAKENLPVHQAGRPFSGVDGLRRGLITMQTLSFTHVPQH